MNKLLTPKAPSVRKMARGMSKNLKQMLQDF